MKLIILDIKDNKTDSMVRFVVECITVIGDTFIFNQNGLEHRYHLENYKFIINGSMEL